MIGVDMILNGKGLSNWLWWVVVQVQYFFLVCLERGGGGDSTFFPIFTCGFKFGAP